MSALVIVGVAVFGGTVGAFLPWIAYRLSVPFGAPPRAACAACHAPLAPGTRAWVRLEARCPHCGARTGVSPVWGALLGAVVCGGLAASLHTRTVLPIVLLTAIAGILLALIDAACMRLPDVIVLPLLGIAALCLVFVSITTDSTTALVRALIASVALAGFYLLLGFIVPSGVGLGDVKLALVLGLILGWFGWGYVFTGAMLAQLIHGAVAIGMLIAKRADRKTLLPMGPALLSGAWLSIAVLPIVFGTFGA